MITWTGLGNMMDLQSIKSRAWNKNVTPRQDKKTDSAGAEYVRRDCVFTSAECIQEGSILYHPH